MKKAVILHAMEQTSSGHWYPWLKAQLESRGYRVWTPDLPDPAMPNNQKVKDFLLQSDWDFNETLVIGHSSGSMQLLYLLQNLSSNVRVETAVMVSSFSKPVPGMEKQHVGLFEEPYDYEAIMRNAKNRIFVHGRDDPWCPLEGAEELARNTNSELVVVNNGGHFSTSLDPKYTEFPELLRILDERSLI